MGTALLAKVDGLAELVGSNIEGMEEQRRLTDDVVEAIRFIV